MDYSKELAFAKKLAQEAGKIIKAEFYEQHDGDMKHDDSPVTVIDKKINELVLKGIESEFSGDAFDGEEGKGGDQSSNRVWICDPIDGTISFMLSIPACMFVLGLRVDGVWQVAVAYNPITEELYEALLGKGAYKNGKLIKVSVASSADRSFIVIDAKAYRESPEIVAHLESDGYQVSGINGSGAKVMKVAEGLAAGIFRDNGDYHDIGVCSLIASEAGAKVSSLTGGKFMSNSIELEDGFIIANPVAHADILKAAQST